MGAKKKTGKDEKKPQVIELTEEQKALFAEALGTIQSLVDDIQQIGTPIREWALGFTKLEEAEMWIDRGFAMLGIELNLDDEEGEEDEDDGDEPDEDEDE